MAEQKNQVVQYENVADKVLARIKQMESIDALHLPKNYAVDNALKAAWLELQETEDRAHNKALTVCSKDSIANALLDMVLQGLSVAKKQGYFIVYGNKLTFSRSYFGSMAVAKRTGAVQGTPDAQVIYEGDDFIYTIEDGNIKIVKHDQKLENVNNDKIKAVYAVVTLTTGEKQVTIMTKDQVLKAWNQGQTKGGSPAHKNFPEEMAKKTVINRALKHIINSMDDAWLYEGKADETDMPDTKDIRNEQIAETATQHSFAEPAEFEDVTDTPETPETPETKQEDGPGY